MNVNDETVVHFLVFVICLLLAAFFCSADTAFIGTQKLRLQHLIRSGHRAAETAARIVEKPEKFLATVLLVINLFETPVVYHRHHYRGLFLG